MCIGNRASSASFYINKQLETLWEISNECVKKHGYGIKATRAEVEYGSSLSQICIGKHKTSKPHTDDLTFFAAFGAAPKLKFICNHELVLELHLKAGHYKLEGKYTPEHFENYTCAFRVQFHEHTIKDTAYSKFGLTESCKTKFVILDLNTATFIRDFSSFANHKLKSDKIDRHHKNIVKQLTTHYLPLLRKAGFHCIYSLPDFDNLSRTHHIDHSLVSDIEIEIGEICGIDIEAVNTFLSGRWLEAAASIDNLPEHHDHSHYAHYALAEHRGICEDIHFHAYFGPPHIQARCSKEVVFYIDIHELLYYFEGFNSEVSHKISGWKIALLVDVIYVEEDEGSVKRLKLDFSKARFCETRSICISETIEESILVRLRSVFIQYITERYLFILEEHHHHHIYHCDIRVKEEEEYEQDEQEHDGRGHGNGHAHGHGHGGDVEGGIIRYSNEFRERLCITETFGYDIITTVSQGSINDHLRSIWKAAQHAGGCLAGWAHDEYFDAAFGPLQIQFPSNPQSHTAIVYVNLIEGYLTNLGHGKKCIGGEKHDFSGWKLAFEITLTMRDYVKAHAISDGYLKVHEHIGEYVLKQLTLNFDSAKFSQSLSRLPGLFEGGDCYIARLKLGALLHYITHFYFHQLKREGHQVLYTIPTWKDAGSCSVIKYAPSSFDFQFYPVPCGEDGNYISSLFGHHRNFGDRNMLVMYGMVGSKSPPAGHLPPCSWKWSISEQKFSGMFALSRSIFLDGWLLKQLMHINGRTTLVPVFHGIGESGAWDIELVKWYDHPLNKNRSCAWKPKGMCEGGLEFVWKYSDEWTYAHHGDTSHVHDGGYTVSCKTTNSLILPTVNHHGICEIQITGKVELRLCFSGSEGNWSTDATAHWRSSILLTPNAHGTGLTITETYKKDIPESSGFTGQSNLVHPKFKDASTHLQEQLSSVVFVEADTIHGLESSFAGVWPLFYSGSHGYTLANPVFNSCGDLLFELVSPIDRRGYVTVPEKTRRDIHLPQKNHSKSRYLDDYSHLATSTPSLSSTVITAFETPITTPGLDRTLSYTSSSVFKIGEEEDAQTVDTITQEKVNHTLESAAVEVKV